MANDEWHRTDGWCVFRSGYHVLFFFFLAGYKIQPAGSTPPRLVWNTTPSVLNN